MLSPDPEIAPLDPKMRLTIGRIPAGGITRLPGELWPFTLFFLRQIKLLVAGICFFQALLAVLVSTMLWYVGVLVEKAEYTQAIVWLCVAVFMLRLVAGAMAELLLQKFFVPYVGNLIRRQLYWYTIRQPLSFFQDDFSGRIANKLLHSAPCLRDAIKSTIGVVLFAGIFTASNIYFLSTVSWWMAATLALWLVAYVATLWRFVPEVHRRSIHHADVMSTVTGQVVDSFSNVTAVKYFSRTEHEDGRVLSLLERHSAAFRAATNKIWEMSFIVEVLNTLLLISTTAIGFYYVVNEGQAGIAALAMALPMTLQVTIQATRIMFEVSQTFENIGTVQEGISILAKPRNRLGQEGLKTYQPGELPPRLSFRDVEFSYRSGNEAQRKTVLSGFDLEIPPGQSIGLIGKSGAGKSTVANLITRLCEIEAGTILIDGVDIRNYSPDSLRRQIGIVAQDSFLFHRSVLDNIRYGDPDATREAVISAARKADAHDFIVGLRDSEGRSGYDSFVGERGVKLSGGQKQRIALARAILKNAPLLILDEATSALDSESEENIHSSLETVVKNRTVIVISHRMSTLKLVDRIVFLENGRVVEDGTHDDLIAIGAGGRYAESWWRQSSDFGPGSAH